MTVKRGIYMYKNDAGQDSMLKEKELYTYFSSKGFEILYDPDMLERLNDHAASRLPFKHESLNTIVLGTAAADCGILVTEYDYITKPFDSSKISSNECLDHILTQYHNHLSSTTNGDPVAILVSYEGHLPIIDTLKKNYSGKVKEYILKE